MFFDIFSELCKEKGVSCKKAAEQIGLSNSITTKWKKTGATPSGDTLEKIADYFGVSTDYLLGKQQSSSVLDLFRGINTDFCKKIEPTDDGKLYSGREALRFALWGGDVDNLDDDDLDDVLRYAEFIRERKKKQAEK